MVLNDDERMLMAKYRLEALTKRNVFQKEKKHVKV